MTQILLHGIEGLQVGRIGNGFRLQQRDVRPRGGLQPLVGLSGKADTDTLFREIGHRMQFCPLTLKIGEQQEGSAGP